MNALPRLGDASRPTLQTLSAASDIAIPAQTLQATLVQNPAPQERLATAPQTNVEKTSSKEGDTYIFHITPTPGMSAQDVAQEIQRELKRREGARRGDLHDGVDH